MADPVVAAPCVRAAVALRPDMTRTEAAVAIVLDSRRTHLEWARHLERHPEDAAASSVGDAVWHRECVENYDLVLAVLGADPSDMATDDA